MAAVLMSTPHRERQRGSERDTMSQTNFDFTMLTSLEALIRSQHEDSVGGINEKTQLDEKGKKLC